MKGSGRSAPTLGHLVDHVVISGGRVFIDRNPYDKLQGKIDAIPVQFLVHQTSSILVVALSRIFREQTNRNGSGEFRGGGGDPGFQRAVASQVSSGYTVRKPVNQCAGVAWRGLD